MIEIDNTISPLYFPNSTLYYTKDENRIVKVCKNRPKACPLSASWLRQYQMITNDNDYFVKVYATNNHNTIEMEKLDIVCDVKHLLEYKNRRLYKDLLNKQIFLDIMIAMQSTWLSMFQTSVFDNDNDDDRYVLHGDYTLANLVITKDRKVKLVDPDSVGWFDLSESMRYVRKFYMSQMELMNSFQDFYYSKQIDILNNKRKKLQSKFSDMNKNV